MRLVDFVGHWAIDRVIDDRRSASQAKFTGECRYLRDGSSLRLEETGSLRLADGSKFAASRRFIWKEADGKIHVHFDDGRPFHVIDLHTPVPTDTHLCGRDTYRVAYDFIQWPNWQAVWHVSGPQKDYRMVTGYVLLDSVN